MARPKKQTIDYFPHSCTHGKTMFIIEQKYGNDGYAFWFKLLELLGDTAGHYIDLNDEATQEFLQAKTRISWDLCHEILDLLAKLEAIDAELWEHKIVWSQNYVDGISDVYKNRRTEIPSRPSFYIEKPHDAGISTDENPQSKVKESKVKESKVKESKVKESKVKNIFIPPTLEEVAAYCQERNNGVDPQKWYDFYSAKGWMIGKNKMMDWRAAVRTWEMRQRKGSYTYNYEDGGDSL